MDIEDFITIIISIALIICICRISTSKELFTTPIKEYNGMKSLNHHGEPYNLKKYGPDMVKIMQEMT